jgi:hypothetical protein
MTNTILSQNFMPKIVLACLSLIFAQSIYATEEPKYEIVPIKAPANSDAASSTQAQSSEVMQNKSIKYGFEIRRYQPMLVARATHEQTHIKKALNAGFRELADYIFGNNQQKIKIEMTAPVLENMVADAPTNQKFLSTPDHLNLLGKPNEITQAGYQLKRHIYFVMPKSYDMNTISKPNNPKVELINMPARVFAVKKHGYIWRTEKIDQMKKDFLMELKAQNVIQDVAKSLPDTYIAVYNPPFTPPPFAKNEIWVELKDY